MNVAAGAAVCLMLRGVSPCEAARELVDPPTLRSENGRLLVRLSAARAPLIVGDRRFDGMFYNGAYIPELWRVRPGDKLVVTLSNKLPEITNLEPRIGGRWFERGDDGSECNWGRVLVWEPPRRVVLAWEINADWKYDPSVASEVEIRFIPESAKRTRVEPEHRKLERYGDKAEMMRSIFDSEGAWAGTLTALAKVAERRS